MLQVAYDPRDVWQRADDPSTWRPTDNPVLIRAAKAKGVKSADYWQGIALLAAMHDEDAADERR
jgi:hypothetical protein